MAEFLHGFVDQNIENKSILSYSSTPAKSIVANSPSNAQSILLSDDSAQKRRDREFEESELLARALMEEESLHAYELQIAYLRDNCELDADMLAAYQIVNDGRITNSSSAVEVDEISQGQDMSVNENTEEEMSNEWTYERLLALGEQIGDVKTERWKLVANTVLDKLPSFTYDKILQGNFPAPIAAGGSTSCKRNIQDVSAPIQLEQNCVICMEDYDKVENLILFPCLHYFHYDCGWRWAESHSSCPVCKGEIL